MEKRRLGWQWWMPTSNRPQVLRAPLQPQGRELHVCRDQPGSERQVKCCVPSSSGRRGRRGRAYVDAEVLKEQEGPRPPTFGVHTSTRYKYMYILYLGYFQTQLARAWWLGWPPGTLARGMNGMEFVVVAPTNIYHVSIFACRPSLLPLQSSNGNIS